MKFLFLHHFKVLFGFFFHFLCFLFSRFCKGNGENRKSKQETGFIFFMVVGVPLNGSKAFGP